MAKQKFKGFKQVLQSVYDNTDPNVRMCYMWLVREDENDIYGDIYMGNRRYGTTRPNQEGSIHFEVYPSLNDIATPSNSVLYLIGPDTSAQGDQYEEYIYYNENFVKIGDTSIDLSGYATTEQLTDGLNEKQDTIADLDAIRSGSTLGLTAIQSVKTINSQSITGTGNVDLQEPIDDLDNIRENATYGASAYTEINGEENVYTFGGIQISNGPLFYENDTYVIKDEWIFESFENAYGEVSGSTYFSFVEMGKLFDNDDFSTSNGDIHNIKDPFSGWRLPNRRDIEILITTDKNVRPGSTVNGRQNTHWAFIRVPFSSVPYAKTVRPYGLLVFPDDKNITGLTLTYYDELINNPSEATHYTSVNRGNLTQYLNQGCVFLPCGGFFSDNGEGWKSGGFDGTYWCTEQKNFLYTNVTNPGSGVNKTELDVKTDEFNTLYGLVRLVKDAPIKQRVNFIDYSKQGTITDLDAIRSGSRLGSTAVQPSELLFESGEESHSVQQKGNGAVASGQGAVAFGRSSQARGNYSHAEGSNTQVTGTQAHVEGDYSVATGDASHAEGWSTQTINPGEHAEGKFNKSHSGQTPSSKTISSIGIGEDAQHRKNAVEIMVNGDAYLHGVGGYDGTNPESASTVKQVIDGKQPTIDANHKLDYSFLDNTPSIPAAQVQSDWNQSDNTQADFIKNKPTIPAAQVNADWNAVGGVAEILNKPTIPAAQVNADWNEVDANSKAYIQNKPTIPTVPTISTDIEADKTDNTKTASPKAVYDAMSEDEEVTAAALCELEEKKLDKDKLVDTYNSYVANAHEKAASAYALYNFYRAITGDLLADEEILATALNNLNALGILASAIAPLYKAGTRTFAVDDCCIYESQFYRCTTAVTSPEPFDPTKWERTNAYTVIMSRIKTMQGATASAAGSDGYAPAPAAGDNEKFLRGDGTWQTPSASIPQEIMNLIYAGL